MKAAVWNGPYELSIKEVPVPSPVRDEGFRNTPYSTEDSW